MRIFLSSFCLINHDILETGDSMKEIEKNKAAWSLLSKDHYEHYKKMIEAGNFTLNKDIIKDLGDVRGKSLIHLQCNTGADSIALKKLGLSKVLGVDLSETNVYYATKMAEDFNLENISFMASDVLKLDQIHHERYDIVFTSEGVLGWLPDLKRWAEVIKHVIKPDGFFYVYDSHPFFHVLDEEKISEGILEAKYPYFDAKADLGYDIGGYAGSAKKGENYWWNHTMSDIINSLLNVGLELEFFNEFDTLFWDNGNMEKVSEGLYQYKQFKGKLPLSYAIKARPKKEI